MLGFKVGNVVNLTDTEYTRKWLNVEYATDWCDRIISIMESGGQFQIIKVDVYDENLPYLVCPCDPNSSYMNIWIRGELVTHVDEHTNTQLIDVVGM